MSHRTPRRLVPLFLLFALLPLSVQAHAQVRSTAPGWLQAPAEAGNYQTGGTLYEPLMRFVYELQSRTELMNVVKLTETLGRRDVVLAILSNLPVFQPSDLVYSGKPVVLIVNNVHGGEVAGKDASLELMRDLVMGDLRPLLDEVVVLVIPTINPDGAEVRRRTNDEGFDMNRDYLKLESQEIHALITKVMNEWQPHIHVDTHHGGAAPYTLTYQTNMNPAGDQNLVRFGNERILPRVRAGLRAEDYDGFWYSGPGRVDGVEGWTPTSVEPRKQHVYSTLANVVGFLYETPSGSHRVVDNGTRVVEVPAEERYRHQVRGEYIGQRELIRFAAEHPGELKEVVARARWEAIVRGNDVSDEDRIPLEYRQVENFRDRYWRRVGGGGGFGPGAATGPVEYELVEGPVFTRWEVTRSTTRPWGYLFPNSLTKVVPLLLEHGITVKRLTRPLEVEVEVYYATEITDAQYFQGHYLKKVKAEKRTETVTLPAGSFFVPSGQPKSNLVSYLLEPETDDNLITWSFLDHFLRRTPSQEEGAEAPRPQQVPIYRVMRKAEMAGVLVEPFHQFERNRYIR